MLLTDPGEHFLSGTDGPCLAGDKMMVPLTESLYVEGYVHEKDKILVDIGTGYFAEVCIFTNLCQRRHFC